MPVRDRQLLITNLVAKVLGQEPVIDHKFDWFINKHVEGFFQDRFSVINEIFECLNVDIDANFNKGTKFLECDAYFGGNYNFMFEYDEFQHFSTPRLKTLERYPNNLDVNYDVRKWKEFCRLYSENADKYRFNKSTKDFNFKGGRTCQRAYLDCFRDFLPEKNGLNPTLRISEFEVVDIHAETPVNIKKISKLINARLRFT